VYIETALVAYGIDRLFGEPGFVRHPVVLMGDYVQWFEKRFYRNSIARGALLTLTLLAIVFALSTWVQWMLGSPGDDGGRSCGLSYGLSGSGEPDLPWCHAFGWGDLLGGLIASTTIASKMLYDSVREIITHPEKIRYLVSRDTEELSPSDIRKAAIETYAENLSDGVIAPLLYLLLFGLPGAFVYKAVNTLDSMVGYRNERYELFGKVAARLDDVANYVPARITAVLIMVLLAGKSITQIYQAFRNGQKHPSPNAGYPIAAMAYALGIRLGGPTRILGSANPKRGSGRGGRNWKMGIFNGL